MTQAPGARIQRRALGLMLASGFAGLSYQIVWTQQCTLWLGHENAAVLAVLTAFFGGLALGALLLGRRIERSARPERWYAACELVIALWSGALALLMAPVATWMLQLTGAEPSPAWQWTVAFCGTTLLLLPATAAMGATLPAMQRLLATPGQPAAALAALYACNTAGAVLGVLATAFWLVPTYGLARTAGLCAVLNLACAAAALRLRPAAHPTPEIHAYRRGKSTLALLAVTGLLGIAYEVLVVRVISQVTENTVYTFALLLAVYLVGTALGAAAYQRWAGRHLHPVDAAVTLRDRLLALLAGACLLGTGSLWAAQALRDFALATLGAGMAPALAAEALLALAAFGLPTLVMGALFSHLCTQARTAGWGFSAALGVNTLGAAAAPLLFGLGIVPLFGAKAAMLAVAAAYAALLSRRAWARPPAWAAAAATCAIALWAPPLVFVDVPEGGRVLSYTEGPMAAVSVVEDAQGVARLRINNRQQEGSSASLLADARQALLPLLLHRAPQRALFLGLGTGVTAGAAAADPTLRVDVAELLPEVMAASSYFKPALADGATAPPLHTVAADARRFVRAAGPGYDVIVSDNFHPARSGSGALYTVEHFQAVRARLNTGGLFCQWLPLHQLDLATLRSIVRSFVAVYPNATALLATNSLQTPVLGLLARAGEGRFKLQSVRQRLQHNSLPQDLPAFGLADDFALLGSFIAGPRALARWAASAPLNTDDHTVVAYTAPRITYAPDSQPGERLLALLDDLHADPGELMDDDASAGTDAATATATDTDAATDAATAWPRQLAAYWTARHRFLVAGRGIRPSGDARQMLAQVRAPLLDVLHTSPHFRPAYDPLLRMALALGRDDAAAARALLTELLQAQPARPEAALALRQLAMQAPAP